MQKEAFLNKLERLVMTHDYPKRVPLALLRKAVKETSGETIYMDNAASVLFQLTGDLEFVENTIMMMTLFLRSNEIFDKYMLQIIHDAQS